MVYHFLWGFDLAAFSIGGRAMGWFVSGDLAVDFFFVLSGFVLANAYGRQFKNGLPFADYLRRRLVRLYPMMAIGILIGAVALAVPVIARFGARAWPGLTAGLALNLALLPVGGSPYALRPGMLFAPGEPFAFNPPAWSLFYELVLSAGFAFAWRLPARAFLGFSIVSFLAMTSAAIALAHSEGQPVQLAFGDMPDAFALLRALQAFALGVWLWLRFGLRGRTGRMPRLAHPILLALLLLAALAMPTSAHGLTSVAFLFVLAPLLILAGASSDDRLTGATRSACRFLGWISFPLYCVHSPVGQIVWLTMAPGWSPGVVLVTSIAASLGVAALAARFIEEPVRRWLTARFATR